MAFDYSIGHALRTQKKNWSCQKVYKRWAFDLMNSVPWSNQYNHDFIFENNCLNVSK